MKCRRCKRKAVVDLKSHNTAFCRECFLQFVHRQVERAIKEHRMFRKGQKLLVCVSGGKDSLVLWEILSSLGHEVDGLHINLGIEGYSERSEEKVMAFAEKRGLKTTIVSLQHEGIPIPRLAKVSKRSECSICGTVKRHFFNKIAVEGGYEVVVTGHNLDDEAARLLGNLLHWQWEYLLKQSPVLPAVGDSLVKKVEPLCRLTERETAAYAILKGIDYVIEECPLSLGSTSIRYKQILNRLEDWMPGTKANFFRGFLRYSNVFKQRAVGDTSEQGVARCSLCGFPSYMDPCNFCRLTRPTT